MTFKDLKLKDSYSSDEDGFNPLHDFYIPVLGESIEYDRLAGFFSSTSLSIAARGIAGLLRNNGRMRLVCSPRLTPNDIDAIRRSLNEDWHFLESWEELLARSLLSSLELGLLKTEIAKDHFSAVAWLLKSNRLEIRLSVPRDTDGMPMAYQDAEQSGIFHMKIGIFTDGLGNSLSFSGSINESVSAWIRNAEEFKVFRSWIEPNRVDDDKKIFKRHWENMSSSWQTVSLPEAVKEELLSYASDDEETILKKLEKYTGTIKYITPTNDIERTGIKLRWYQQEAVDSWFNNNRHGILSMATASGKTYVAVACLKEIIKGGERLLAVIAVPDRTLVSQWVVSLRKVFSENDILQMLGMAKVNVMATMISEVSIGLRSVVIIVTTHETSSKQLFHSEIAKATNCTLVLVGDEAHGQGAQSHRTALSSKYDARLGLSATPKRNFDEEGTDILLDYYNGIIYEFPIGKAIQEGILTPYYYHPIFVHMTIHELEEYLNLTKRLSRKLAGVKNEKEREEILAKIAFIRANIMKKASSKLEALDTLLNQLGSDITHCFIYCQDSAQLEAVKGIVKANKLTWHEFTGSQGTTPETNGKTERDIIFSSFSSGLTQVLLAMKCLDQGVDVPEARIGIILASSQSSREFIQRRGRLLRLAPKKEFASIYDFIVAPSGNFLYDKEYRLTELKIFEIEIRRATQFSDFAKNRADCIAEISRHSHF